MYLIGMEENKIIVVGGYIGCGKTSWIYQQIALKQKAVPKCCKKILYLKAGTGKVHIDQKRISIDFPEVRVFCDTQKADFLNELESADIAYIELDNNLGLGYIEKLLNDLAYYPVAILPPGCKQCKWHSCSQEVLIGAAIKALVNPVEILKIATTGKIISGNNFNDFWNQIISGTYGKVFRAKGIFHLDDGNVLYADFIDGVECIDFVDLNLSGYLHGQPKFFSGLEIVGFSLKQVVIQQIIENIYIKMYSIIDT